MNAIAVTLFAAALAGCTTPQVVLDQASNGASLSSELAGRLDVYAQATRAIDDERRAALRRQHERAVSYRLLEAETELTYMLAGQASVVDLYRQMKSSADIITKVREDGANDVRRYSEELDAIGKPLPPVGRQLQAVQGGFAQLATKPSAAERLKALRSAWQDAKSPVPAPAAAAAASAPN